MQAFIGRRALLGAGAGWFMASSVAKAAEVTPTPIAGAGSSFIDPVMKRWIKALPAALGVDVSYEPNGSGKGRNAILAGDVDFGMSDEPLPDDKLATGNLVQFPLAFGAIVCVVNIPGIDENQMVLTGPLLAGIYAGSIKKWNDPKIVAANPAIKLPDLDIRPVSEGTPNGPMPGSTYNFTQYLLATNQDWRDKYGPAITRRWAVGSMAASNAFMTETIGLLPGSIGYLALGLAAKNKMTTVMLRNKAGKAVAATSGTIAAAVGQADWAHTPNLMTNLLNLPGDEAWPITVATYAIVPKTPKHPEAMRNFLRFVIAKPELAARVYAAAMPPELATAALAKLGISGG